MASVEELSKSIDNLIKACNTLKSPSVDLSSVNPDKVAKNILKKSIKLEDCGGNTTEEKEAFRNQMVEDYYNNKDIDLSSFKQHVKDQINEIKQLFPAVNMVIEAIPTVQALLTASKVSEATAASAGAAMPVATTGGSGTCVGTALTTALQQQNTSNGKSQVSSLKTQLLEASKNLGQIAIKMAELGMDSYLTQVKTLINTITGLVNTFSVIEKIF